MNEQNTYVLHIGTLFNALNRSRSNNNLQRIENPLIASKLGILFALKTSSYVNFKGEYTKLDDYQLLVLQEICEEHFNVHLAREIRNLATLEYPQPTTELLSTPEQSGFIQKIKGFFKHKTKVQEHHA